MNFSFEKAVWVLIMWRPRSPFNQTKSMASSCLKIISPVGIGARKRNGGDLNSWHVSHLFRISSRTWRRACVALSGRPFLTGLNSLDIIGW